MTDRNLLTIVIVLLFGIFSMLAVENGERNLSRDIDYSMDALTHDVANLVENTMNDDER